VQTEESPSGEATETDLALAPTKTKRSKKNQERLLPQVRHARCRQESKNRSQERQQRRQETGAGAEIQRVLGGDLKTGRVENLEQCTDARTGRRAFLASGIKKQTDNDGQMWSGGREK
jgi:hypothetical protein